MYNGFSPRVFETIEQMREMGLSDEELRHIAEEQPDTKPGEIIATAAAWLIGR